MPIISAEIPEIIESVIRPIVFDITRNILSRTGIGKEASVLLNKDGSEALQLNSALGSISTDVKFDSKEHIRVSMEEEYSEDDLLDKKITDSGHHAIFYDKKLEVWIKPVYYKTRTTLSFELQFNSETRANNWMQGIRRRLSGDRQHNRHTVQYHYPITVTFMHILVEIWKLRENVGGYGDTFGTWLRNHFTDRVTVMTNQAGRASIYAINETQTGINGWFDFDRPPKPSKTDNLWTASFGYTFEYDKPGAFAMAYPLMVHNQIVPGNLRVRGENFNALVDPEFSSHTTSRLAKLNVTNFMPGSSYGGISIPSWDEWMPDRIKGHYSTAVRAMVQVDVNNPRNLLDLDKLGLVQLDPTVREHMAKYPECITQLYQHPYHITLFRNNLPLYSDALTVTDDLQVLSTFDLDIRHRYHICITVITDISMLSDVAVDGLLANGEYIKRLASIINSDFDISTIPILDNNTLGRPQWMKLRTELSESIKHFRNHLESNILTVGNFVITANKT